MKNKFLLTVGLLASNFSFSQSSSDKEMISELINERIGRETIVVWNSEFSQKKALCHEGKPNRLDLLLKNPAYLTRKKLSDVKDVSNISYSYNKKQVSEQEFRNCDNNHRVVYEMTSLGSENLNRKDNILKFGSIKVTNASWTKPVLINGTNNEAVYFSANYAISLTPEQIPVWREMMNQMDVTGKFLARIEKENGVWSMKQFVYYQ